MPVEEDDNGAEIGPVPLRGGAEEEAQEREQLRARRAALLSAAQAEVTFVLSSKNCYATSIV